MKQIIYSQLGLRLDKRRLVRKISEEVFTQAEESFKHALKRCTFFAEHGYEHLVEAVGKREKVGNPRIEGCDENPFDQHYWLAFDLLGDKPGAVLVDPIFGYVGLENFAEEELGPDYAEYYRRKRVVPPHQPSWEGGVRVKTMGI